MREDKDSGWVAGTKREEVPLIYYQNYEGTSGHALETVTKLCGHNCHTQLPILALVFLFLFFF